MELYNDNYKNVHEDKKAFMDEVKDREANTERVIVKSHDITVGELYRNEYGELLFVHLECEENTKERYPQDQYSISAQAIHSEDIDTAAAENTVEKGSCLAIAVRKDDTVRYYPISDVAKTSLNNRTGDSFNGELSEDLNDNLTNPAVPPLTRAKIYDTHLKAKNSTLQLIVVYGKVQAIMSSRYTQIEQQAVFDAVENECEKQGYKCDFFGGVISHRSTSCMFSVANNNLAANGYSVGLTVDDSSTGFSGVHIYPIIMKDDIKIGFDDAYSTKHVGLSMDDIPEGVKACMLKLEDNVSKIIDATTVTLQHPMAYIKNAFEALNNLVKRMPGTTMTDAQYDFVKEQLEEALFLNTSATLYDVIEMFWAIPEQFKKSSNRVKNPDEYKKRLEKTVSRILVLEHEKLDKVD